MDKNKKRDFIFSLVFLLLSLLFKETTLFLFIFYPIYFVLDRKQKFKFSEFKKSNWMIFWASGFLYAFLRVLFLFSDIRSVQPEVVDVKVASITTYIVRFLSVPLRGFSQSFLPQKFLISISDFVTRLFYPQFILSDGSVNGAISQTLVFDRVTGVLTFVILIFLYLSYKRLRKIKENVLSNTLVLFVIFGLTSLIPFIFIPGKAGYFSIFEPRNLYITGIAASLLIGLAVYKRGTGIAFLLLMLPFFLFHFLNLELDLSKLKEISIVRRSFLEKIYSDYPTLPEDVIFLTISDRPYYGMPEKEKILPVQVGFGKMIMIWYQDTEKFPSCLYDQQFLLGLLSQDYKDCGGRGFGYFRDYTGLIETIRFKDLKQENVISYSWDGQNQEFKNITSEIRSRVKKDLMIIFSP